MVTEERNVELKRELLRLRLFVDHFLLPKVRLTYVHLVVFLLRHLSGLFVNIMFRFSLLKKYLFIITMET